MIPPSLPGRVLSVEGTIATLDIRGVHVTANARLTPVKPGDFVLVYCGVILRVLDAREAEDRLRTLEGLESGPVCPAPA
jgi:hydrogenase assembly chaperone HypC/HupF